jgi:hypothetical protein
MPSHFAEKPDMTERFETPAAGNDRLAEVERVKAAGKGSKRHTGRIVAVVLLVVVAVVAVLGFVGYGVYKDAKVVEGDANAIVSDLTTFKNAVKSGDASSIDAPANDIAEKSSEMHRITAGTSWNVAALLPVYGSDVSQVQQISASLDDLSQNAVLPVAQTLKTTQLSSIMQSDGSVDVATLQSLIGILSTTKDVFARTTSTFDGLGSSHIDKLGTAISKARDQLDKLNAEIQQADEIAPVLPQLLGANGSTKSYLVLAQNNAEIRATGGFAGSWGTISVTDGKLTFGQFEAEATFPGFSDLFSITDEERNLFGETLLTHENNVNSTPDFTRVGYFAKSIWDSERSQNVDGVIAVDPVFLQSLLALTGESISMSDGTSLDGSNAATVLMHDCYLKYDPSQQDIFFGEAASKCFASLTTNIGKVGLTKLVDMLKSSASDYRIQVWMADEQTEAVIKQLGFGGEISTDATKPVLGVYLNDETWGKMGWYIKLDTQVGVATKNADGSSSYEVTTTLSNMSTSGDIARSGTYITGSDTALKRGTSDLVTRIYLYAPAGGAISSLSTDGDFSTEMSEASYTGLDVWFGMTQDLSGETSTISYTVTTSPQATSALAVRSTPTAQQVAGW